MEIRPRVQTSFNKTDKSSRCAFSILITSVQRMKEYLPSFQIKASENMAACRTFRYDEIIPLHYSLLLITYRQKSSLSFWTGCDCWRSGWDLLLRSINFESTRSGVTIHTKSPPGWVGFLYGGVGGIRTHGTVAGTPDFESGPL